MKEKDNQIPLAGRKNNLEEDRMVAFTRYIRTLEDDKIHLGGITEMKKLTNPETKKQSLSIKIKLDESGKIFPTSFKLPLSDFSPINDFFASIADENATTFDVTTAIGLSVKFGTVINDRFCNIDFIELNDKKSDDNEDELDYEDEEENDDE